MSSTSKSEAVLANLSDRMNKAEKAALRETPLTPSQQECLEKLKELHLQSVKHEYEYREEWLKLKLKYYNIVAPLYVQRFEALKKGVSAPVAQPADVATPEASSQVTGVPEFWLQALMSHSIIADNIEAIDEPILRYLENITYQWEDETEQQSFTVMFHFAPNPYFTNDALSKKFLLQDEPESNESVLVETVGTAINWKPGKDVTTKVVTKRQRNKSTGEVRTVKTTTQRNSFFHFFESHVVPEPEVLEAMREEEVYELESVLEIDYEIGCVLRDRIIPHAVGWYLGIEFDDESHEDGENEDEDDDDEDDEGDFEDDDDEEDADEDSSDDDGAPPPRDTDKGTQ